MTDLVAWLVANGYPIIFLMLLASGLGVPVPEDVPLIAAGVLADNGGMPVATASAACGIFVLARDSIVYFLGRRFGVAFFENRWARRIVSQETVHTAQHHLERRGALVVFVGRFLPGFRAAVFFAAGASKVRPLTFFTMDFLAALISLPFFVWVGYAFSKNLPRIQEIVSQFRAVSMSVVALIAVVVLWRWWRARKAEAAQAPDGGAVEEPR
ncbi:MAG: DedA family protein [Deltaproteobacteria bacterium]|nr:DedA family protein [Deltaproteobacteria bacterium]